MSRHARDRMRPRRRKTPTPPPPDETPYWVAGVGWCGPGWSLMEPEADEGTVTPTRPRTLAEQYALEDEERSGE